MKKKLSFFSVLFLTISIGIVGNSSVYATTLTKNSIPPSIQTTTKSDLAKFLDQAKLGKVDTNSGFKLKSKNTITSSDGKNLSVNKYEKITPYTKSNNSLTSDSISTTNQNSSVNSYAITEVSLYSTDSDEYKHTSTTDPQTYSVTAYSTVYVDDYYRDGAKYRLLLQVDGGYTILDSSVSITSENVLLGARGNSYYDNSLVNVTNSNNVIGFTFSIGAPYWPPVYGQVGAVNSATLHRGGSSWTFENDNNYTP